MDAFAIGMSGLVAAQRAIELISTNIANATTPGYHRQDPVYAASRGNVLGNVSVAGVELEYVRRNIDTMLEQEILQQQSSLSQNTQELDALRTMESAFGTMNAEDLGSAMSGFFGAMTELSGQPDSGPLQEQAVSAADSVATKFNDLAQFLAEMHAQIGMQIQELIGQANTLAQRVAELNAEVSAAVTGGGAANILRDQRDQAIADLADLVGLDVYESPNMLGATNVTVWGLNAVEQQRTTPLSVTQDNEGHWSLTVGDTVCGNATDGGKVGALFSIVNGILSDTRSNLDTLAGQFAAGVNELHVQGLGSGGSFTELTGLSVASGTLASWPTAVTAGTINVRVINTATGEGERYSCAIDPAADTVATVAAKLDAMGHLSATIVGGALSLRAEAGYRFDFTTAMFSEPADVDITGTARPVLSGLCSEPGNRILTAAVSGSGQVGVAEDLRLDVRNEAGEIVASLNLGQGYPPGEELDLGDGMRVRFGAGTLNDGDSFTIEAIGRTDTSGFLAAAGLNTLFVGSTAKELSVRSSVLRDPTLLAVSSGGGDNLNAIAIGELGEQARAALGGLSTVDYFRSLRIGIGEATSVAGIRTDSRQAILDQLNSQRNEISGVDINDEAAKLLVYERMYQAMSRAVTAQDQALKYLFETI